MLLTALRDSFWLAHPSARTSSSPSFPRIIQTMVHHQFHLLHLVHTGALCDQFHPESPWNIEDHAYVPVMEFRNDPLLVLWGWIDSMFHTTKIELGDSDWTHSSSHIYSWHIRNSFLPTGKTMMGISKSMSWICVPNLESAHHLPPDHPRRIAQKQTTKPGIG